MHLHLSLPTNLARAGRRGALAVAMLAVLAGCASGTGTLPRPTASPASAAVSAAPDGSTPSPDTSGTSSIPATATTLSDPATAKAPSPAAIRAGNGTPAGGTGGGCPADDYRNSDGVCVPRPAAAPAPPAGATAQCNDGTYSFSQHRSGTCSHHGGVRRWL